MSPKSISYSRRESFLIVIAAYLAAIFLGYVFGKNLEGRHPLFVAGFADVIATIIVFIFSFRFKNSSIYDPYWSVIPIPIVIYFAYVNPDGYFLRQLIIIILIALWGIRLTYNWARGWPGLHHQDWRYDDLKEKTGKAYWLVSFSGIHLFPTVMVFLGCIPVYYAMKITVPLNWIDIVAVVITLGAIIIESSADEQLRKFKKSTKDKQSIMNQGLWMYSRHPNYFGEVTLWIGLFLFALSHNAYAHLWTGIGPLAMIILFVFISIPMMDERHLKKRQGYEDYMKNTPALIPWFKKTNKE